MPIGRDGGDCLLTALLMLQFPQNLPGLRGRITQENGELTTTKCEIPWRFEKKKLEENVIISILK